MDEISTKRKLKNKKKKKKMKIQSDTLPFKTQQNEKAMISSQTKTNHILPTQTKQD